MMGSTDKVYIVEDDQSVREALAELVQSEGFTARTYDSAEQLLDKLEPTATDYSACMLLDVRLPGVSGITLLEQLALREPTLPVILISAHTDVPLAVQAMKHGAVDILEKPFRGEQVLGRVRDALALHRVRQSRQLESQSLQQRYGQLSQRERQVLELVVRGLLNKQIALELSLSTKTVECHRAKVMEKMEADSLADLVRMAVNLENEGLIDTQHPSSTSQTN